MVVKGIFFSYKTIDQECLLECHCWGKGLEGERERRKGQKRTMKASKARYAFSKPMDNDEIYF